MAEPRNYTSASAFAPDANAAPDLLVLEQRFTNAEGLPIAVDNDIGVKVYKMGDYTTPVYDLTLVSTPPIERMVRSTGVYYFVRVNPSLFGQKPVEARWYAKINGIQYDKYPVTTYHRYPDVSDGILLASYLKDYTLAQLGYPLRDVELTPEQLSLAVDESLNLFNRYVPKMKHGSIVLVSGTTRYPIPAWGRGVIDVQFIRSEGTPLICYTGDTRVKLLNGMTPTMRELYDEYHGTGKGFWVYSYDKASKAIVPGWAHDVDIIKRDAPLAKITLDDGTVIRCTPENKFMTRSGEMKMAKDLQPGESMMPLYTRIEELIKNSPVHDKDYEQCFLPETGEWEFTHRLVAKHQYRDTLAELRNQGKCVIHHADCNRFNNDPINLMFMDWDEHFRLHSEMNKTPERREHSARKTREHFDAHPEARQSLGEKLKDRWAKNRDKFITAFKSKEKMAAQLKNLSAYNDWQGRFMAGEVDCTYAYWKAAGGNVDPSAVPPEERVEAVRQRTARIDQLVTANKKAVKTLAENPEGYEKARQTALRVRSARRKELYATDPVFRAKVDKNLAEGRKEEYRERAKQASAESWNRYQKLKANGQVSCSYEDFKSNKQFVNHKIKSVELGGCEDVYDFVVDEYHNFAVGGERSQWPDEGSRLSWIFGSNSDPLFGRLSENIPAVSSLTPIVFGSALLSSAPFSSPPPRIRSGGGHRMTRRPSTLSPRSSRTMSPIPTWWITGWRRYLRVIISR